jgi:hypothetical protein
MNLVFITSSVEPESGRGAPVTDLMQIVPFVVSSIAGGLVAGSVLAGLGNAVGLGKPDGRAGVAEAVIVAAAVISIVHLQVQGRVSPLPEFHQQVPRRWLRWHRPLTATAYGFILGAGAFTHLRHASMYALALAALVAPSVPVGGAVGGFYGAARGLTLAAAWIETRRGRPPSLRGLDQRDNVALGLAALALPAAMAVSLIT